MQDIFSVKSIVAVMVAASLTTTMFAAFEEASSTLPTEWPISINAVGQPVRSVA